jgi:hypothetical protein
MGTVDILSLIKLGDLSDDQKAHLEEQINREKARPRSGDEARRSRPQVAGEKVESQEKREAANAMTVISG